jgi:hypothetical protein
MEIKLRDVLYAIASENKMTYREGWGKAQNNFDFFSVEMKGRDLFIKDSYIVQNPTLMQQEADRCRFRVLSMIATAGIKHLEETNKDFFEKHPEYKYP